MSDSSGLGCNDHLLTSSASQLASTVGLETTPKYDINNSRRELSSDMWRHIFPQTLTDFTLKHVNSTALHSVTFHKTLHFKITTMTGSNLSAVWRGGGAALTSKQHAFSGSCWLFSSLTLRTCWWRQYAPPKGQNFYRTAVCHNQESSTLHSHRYEVIKPNLTTKSLGLKTQKLNVNLVSYIQTALLLQSYLVAQYIMISQLAFLLHIR
jgi:hypothetical protein